MPGNVGRPLSEMLAIAFMVVGASVGVFLAVDQSLVLRFIVIALGAAVGLLVGRLVAALIKRR